VIELENSISRCKECVSKLSGVRREFVRRAHQINLQTQGEISRRSSSLKRKTMWGEAQFRVTEHSGTLFQEGIKLLQDHTGATHSGVLESLRESQNY
jgi:hypothetical protein